MNMLNEVEYLALHLCVCSSLQKLHAAVLVQEDKKKNRNTGLARLSFFSRIVCSRIRGDTSKVLTRQPHIAEA